MITADVWHSHHWIDFRSWLSALAPAVAATVALVSVQRARSESRDSAIKDRTQRRTEFQLSALRQLAERLSGFLNQEAPQARSGEVEALVALSGIDLPVTRWTLSRNMHNVPDEVGQALQQEQARIRIVNGEEVRDYPLAYSAALQEVVAAIYRLLEGEPEYDSSISQVSRARIGGVHDQDTGPGSSASPRRPGP